MTKVLVLYYSAYGHIEAMANAVAEGAREAGATVDIKRVPELVPAEVAKASYYKVDQAAPVAKIEDLVQLRRDHRRHRHPLRPHGLADGELSRPGRRALGQGRAARQGRRRLHRERDPAWRPGDDAVLDHHQSPAFRHGHGRLELRLRRPDEARRGHRRAPYGATTITGGDGSRQPSANELAGARYQGRQIAETARKLHG